jgi:aspartyl protease family protein
MRNKVVGVLFGLLAVAPPYAASQVQVVGLFPNAAVLLVDGQRKLVKVGQTGPGGVQVVSADVTGALLRVDGIERRYGLSREYSAGFVAPTRQSVSLARGMGGHYWATGSINGQMVPFLVDTGATSVAMNEAQASQLNIDFRVAGQPLLVSTASGTARGWKLRLDSVRVGSIEVLGVDAVVLEGAAPSHVLLGMSFLNQVSLRDEQGMLVLESKL